jgi:hypothetical protein
MKNKTSPKSLSFRPREEIPKHGYDWELYDELDEYGLPRIVRADSLLQAGGGTRIAATCLQKHEPVYLMDHDARLYYYHGFDDIINQYFPMDEFLMWKGGWNMAMCSLTPSKEYWPPFPDGWRHCRCHGEGYILVAEEIARQFEKAVTAGGYLNSYEILRNFPRIIEQALILSEKEN